MSNLRSKPERNWESWSMANADECELYWQCNDRPTEFVLFTDLIYPRRPISLKSPLINYRNKTGFFISTSSTEFSTESYSSLGDPRFHTTLALSHFLKKELPFCWQKEGCYLLNKPFSSTHRIFATGKSFGIAEKTHSWRDTREKSNDYLSLCAQIALTWQQWIMAFQRQSALTVCTVLHSVLSFFLNFCPPDDCPRGPFSCILNYLSLSLKKSLIFLYLSIIYSYAVQPLPKTFLEYLWSGCHVYNIHLSKLSERRTGRLHIQDASENHLLILLCPL